MPLVHAAAEAAAGEATGDSVGGAAGVGERSSSSGPAARLPNLLLPILRLRQYVVDKTCDAPPEELGNCSRMHCQRTHT